ncbi:MAG: L,D-transpeptidase family protein [Halobacteriovoraceae bacterium]|jgi:murein L,D-transpeptidase YafK|nr:L,D-transpeptidase family protein [Halobacteriovoraceae bacterium]
MKVASILTTLLFVHLTMANAEDKSYLPSTIYQLDASFAHHTLVVEKSTHSLFLYQNDQEFPRLVKKYKVLTGKFIGNKTLQGDKKTPEGVYFFQKFHPSQYLTKKYGDYGKIYGAGAFTTNYPNEIDKRSKKTGGGIWLHSTDDDNRVSLGLDSKGCVVAIDKDLKDISQYIDLLNTPVVIVQDLHYQTKESWLKSKNEITSVVNKWSEAWRNKDFETYISSYSKTNFFDSIRGNHSQFKQYKKSVFARKDTPTIEMQDMSILNNGEYVVVTMLQDYTSPVVKDIGKKTLYLQKNASYEWKIVAEKWTKVLEKQNIAFTPNKLKYFSSQIQNKELVNDSESI